MDQNLPAFADPSGAKALQGDEGRLGHARRLLKRKTGGLRGKRALVGADKLGERAISAFARVRVHFVAGPEGVHLRADSFHPTR